MNNLKRVLSLALASVMLIGMMVVGASATDFTDADEIEHQEAVDVLVALDIINGKEDGSYFAPEDNVTRAEMAKMIAVAMKGGNDVNTGTKGVPSFTDIAGHWAESYIEYCYDLGVIAGRGDGTFDPNANVTGTEVTKMVLSALGYDADAYKLKGASWATKTDELARTASPSLYEDLSGVVLNVPATRDSAAQIIWNGLQNLTKKVTPSTNTSTGEVTWQYNNGGDTLLGERYDGKIWYGTYSGNSKTAFDRATNDGEIVVVGGTNSDYSGVGSPAVLTRAEVPSDMDISNIGEHVKVIWKDKTGGINGQPDNKDIIYGVFNVGDTRTLTATVTDITKAADGPSDTGKIEVKDVEYTVKEATAATDEIVVTDYTTRTTAGATTAGTVKGIFEALHQDQSPDTVKFIFDTNNKITKAYVVTYKVARVTSVTASNVTLSGVGSIKIADNDIYDGIAKDDVVGYTKFYNADKDKAFYTVTKAEAVEGKLTAVKKTDNLAIDGTTYKIVRKSGALDNVTDDTLPSVSSTNLDDQIKIYLVGGYVYAIQNIEAGNKNFALITDKDVTGSLTGTLNPWKVTILHTDGSEETLNIHKDSVSAGTTALVAGDVVQGNVVKYTKSNGKLKITQVYPVTGYTAVTATGTDAVYDKDTKKFATDAGGAQGVNAQVAASNSTLFVIKDTAANIAANNYAAADFYAYSLRDMGDVKNTTASDSKVKVIDTKDGQVVVGVAAVITKPGGSSASRVYGIVKSVVGEVKVNDDDYTQYSVDTNGGTYTVYTNDAFAKGDLVTFEPTTDNTYENGDVKTLAAYAVSESVTYTTAAVENYSANDKLLTYWESTKATNAANTTFAGYANKNRTGTTANSITVASDAEIFYVDRDACTMGSEVGVNQFNTGDGRANLAFLTDDKGNVKTMMVESSGKEGLDTKYFELANTTYTTADTTGLTKSGANVDVIASVAEVEQGAGGTASTDKVTYTIKVTGTATTGTATVTLTGISLDAAATKTIGNATMATVNAGDTTVTLNLTAGSVDATFTVKGTVSANVTPA